jgi:hypothetical protein
MAIDDPHSDAHVVVYVNSIGAHQFTKEHPVFPPGTILVKEKLSSADSLAPDLLTVMVKRKAGYDPEHGDWEYLTLDGAATTITSRGKLASCQSCHDEKKSDDYVFRSYLPTGWRNQNPRSRNSPFLFNAE